MARRLFTVLMSVLVSIIPQLGEAQTSRDTWTALAENTGAFGPHTNNCSSAEVFISVGGGDLGFCIEKEEREAALWVTAKQECAEDGKRLPEPAEFQYSCKNPPAGLIDMSDDNEWSSNTVHPMHFGNGVIELSAITFGNGSCAKASTGQVALNTAAAEETKAYRCMR